VKAALGALPEARRKIITSHDAFGYFGKAYGLRSSRRKGFSTESEASAQDVAKIIRQIRQQRIPAVFVENITDHRLLDQIARETGAKIAVRSIPTRCRRRTDRRRPISTCSAIMPGRSRRRCPLKRGDASLRTGPRLFSGMVSAWLSRLTGFAGGALLAAIVVATFVPAAWQVRLGLHWLLEHFLAYFALTLVFSIATRRPITWRLVLLRSPLSGDLAGADCRSRGRRRDRALCRRRRRLGGAPCRPRDGAWGQGRKRAKSLTRRGSGAVPPI